MHKLKIITSTTRPGRKGPAVAAWIDSVARAYGAFDVELLDLAEINLPMMDEPEHPRFKKYIHDHTKQWSAKIDEADAFIIVLSEYNYGFPAPIKNAIDYLYQEWNYKPAGFVSYGGVAAGTRAVQMLKQVLTSIKVVPITEGVHIPMFTKFIDDNHVFNPPEITVKSADAMMQELVKWTEGLKKFRM